MEREGRGRGLKKEDKVKIYYVHGPTPHIYNHTTMNKH